MRVAGRLSGTVSPFRARYDGELREPLMWRQGSQVSKRMARGSVSLLSCIPTEHTETAKKRLSLLLGLSS